MFSSKDSTLAQYWPKCSFTQQKHPTSRSFLPLAHRASPHLCNKKVEYNQFRQSLKLYDQDLYVDNVLYPGDVVKKSNVDEYPFNCIGFLKFKDSYDNTKFATAFLISADLVLTSAHNLFNKLKGVVYKQHYFIPKADGNLHDFAQYKVVEAKFPAEYRASKDKNNINYNYALLKLEVKVKSDKYFQLGYNYTQKVDHLGIFGYNKPSCRLEKNTANQVGLQKTVANKFQENGLGLIHSISTEAGNAGSPIIIQRNKSNIAIAIHRGLIQTRESIGRLITEDLLANLIKWRSQMGGEQFKYINLGNESSSIDSKFNNEAHFLRIELQKARIMVQFLQKEKIRLTDELANLSKVIERQNQLILNARQFLEKKEQVNQQMSKKMTQLQNELKSSKSQRQQGNKNKILQINEKEQRHRQQMQRLILKIEKLTEENNKLTVQFDNKQKDFNQQLKKVKQEYQERLLNIIEKYEEDLVEILQERKANMNGVQKTMKIGQDESQEVHKLRNCLGCIYKLLGPTMKKLKDFTEAKEHEKIINIGSKVEGLSKLIESRVTVILNSKNSTELERMKMQYRKHMPELLAKCAHSNKQIQQLSALLKKLIQDDWKNAYQIFKNNEFLPLDISQINLDISKDLSQTVNQNHSFESILHQVN